MTADRPHTCRHPTKLPYLLRNPQQSLIAARASEKAVADDLEPKVPKRLQGCLVEAMRRRDKSICSDAMRLKNCQSSPKLVFLNSDR
jgi:hypothetical protein